MISEPWIIAHWYLFVFPVAVAVLTYLVVRVILILVNYKLCRLEDNLSALDDGDTEWAMRHARSEQKIFTKMDKLEEKAGNMVEICSSLETGWIPGIILVCIFGFIICLLCAEGASWFNG